MQVILLGAGYWGVNYIKELARNLVAVVEPDKERANYVEQHYNIPVFPELPDDVKYDAAVICTPPDSHVELAYAVASKGRYVLVEKPISTSMEEAFKLKPYKDKVMAGHIYLYHPEVAKLKDEYRQVPINHIITRRTNNGPVRNWQNALWDLAPHDISICNYILGQTPIGVLSRGARDWAFVHLSYIACEAIIYVSWLGGPKTRLVELVPAADKQDRIIFDDMKTVLEKSPMRRMLDDFLSGHWDERCSYETGLEIVNILEKCYV